MREHYGAILQAGGELSLVGSGQVFQAKAFKDEWKLPFRLLVDPQRLAYQAAELERGVLRTLSARSLGYAFSALRKGFRQGPQQGDNFQQGGALVIAPGGAIRFRQASQRTGDHASIEDLLLAVKSANQP